MKVPTPIERGSATFNMTPMIDVVFLLIIFFLVSSHLARQETQVELSLPAADSGESPSDEGRPRVTINITPAGDVLLAGKNVSAADLQQMLATELAKAGEKLEVRIRGDRSIPYGTVEPILLSAAKAGIWNVTFAVLERER